MYMDDRDTVTLDKDNSKTDSIWTKILKSREKEKPSKDK